MSYKIAVVGASGLVGRMMLKVLEERQFPVSDLLPVASSRSAGKEVLFKNRPVKLLEMEESIELFPDIALFSAGSAVSLEYATKFAKTGATVIDNSSAWRMHSDIKLIVPEVNASLLTRNDKIIANPNCSTIQLVVALGPLHRKNRIKRLVISTYQSVTGTGNKALQQLENERENRDGGKVYPYRIDKNCIPQCDDFTENGYTKEEMKLVNETRKILGDERIGITATAVRVPVVGGHSESVNVEFEKPMDLAEFRTILAQAKGIIVQDNIMVNEYPMPINAEGKDAVFVGRIRRDESNPNAINLWIVADNLRKGAATNAVQIAEYLILHKLI